MSVVSEIEKDVLSLPTKVKLWCLCVLVLALVGFVVWTQWPTPAQKEVVAHAPEQIQKDGSKVFERDPNAKPTPPPHIIPKGYKEERRESFSVAPSPAAAASGCPPVRVNLSVAGNGVDRRVIASSPDGDVVNAIDMPIEAQLVPPAPRVWAAGMSYDTRRAVGIWVDRDFNRLRLGAALRRLPDGKAEAEVRVGVSW